MNSRDILREIFEQKLTAQQSEEILSNLLDSPEAGQVQALLMLTRPEWTAYGHGSTLQELSHWRHQGWPARCIRCGREMEIDKFGWKVVDVDGVSALRHIQCP